MIVLWSAELIEESYYKLETIFLPGVCFWKPPLRNVEKRMFVVTTDLSCLGTRPTKSNCISTVRNIQVEDFKFIK